MKLFEDKAGNKIYIRSNKNRDTMWAENKQGKKVTAKEFDKLYGRFVRSKKKKQPDFFDFF